MRKLGTISLGVPLAAVALALGACGSSSPDSSSVIVPAPAAKAVSDAEAEASAKKAVSLCKRAVTNARLLRATAKAELEPTCNKVLTLTGGEAQRLRHVICNEVAFDSSRTEATRERLLASCEREMS